MAILTPMAGRACGWPVVAMVRCLVPLIVVALWAKWDGVKLVIWGTPVLWMRSLAGSCSLIGTFSVLASVHDTGLKVSEIYTIVNIFPIWVALLSWPMFGRFPTGAVWLSIVSSVVGVAAIRGADLTSAENVASANYAALVVVAVSFFTALAMLGLNRLKAVDPRAVVVHFSGTALVFAVLAYFVFPVNEPPEAFDVRHLIELIAIGLSASVGQYFLTRAFTEGDPARISVASLSQFVMVLILDVLVLRDPLNWHQLLGIPLIAGPTLWLMLQRVKTSVLVPDEAAQPGYDEPEALATDAAVGGPR